MTCHNRVNLLQFSGAVLFGMAVTGFMPHSLQILTNTLIPSLTYLDKFLELRFSLTYSFAQLLLPPLHS